MTTTTARPATATPLDGSAPPPARPVRRGLAVTVAFAGYPLLWLLGLSVLAYPLAAAVAGWTLWRRRGPWTELPAPTSVWFLFLLWTLSGMIALDSPDRVLAFLYRETIYLTATALLVLVATSPRQVLPDRRVLRSMGWLWAATVVGGLVAVFAPGAEMTTVTERLLPAALREIGLVQNIVHLQLAAESRFLGFPVGRPEAPFPFTNAWGSHLTLLTPVAIAAFQLGRRGLRQRLIGGALITVAVVPWVLSLNRGAWLSGLVLFGWVMVRQLQRLSGRRLVASAVVALLLGVGIWASPLGDLVAQRLDGPGHSDAGRRSLYVQSVELTAASPIVGHGAPQPNPDGPEAPSIGTHGQLWLLLVSHGVPGLLLYLGFFGTAFVAALRWRAAHSVWLEGTLLVGAVQFPIYELLPGQTIVLAIVAGLCLRGLRAQRVREQAA